MPSSSPKALLFLLLLEVLLSTQQASGQVALPHAATWDWPALIHLPAVRLAEAQWLRDSLTLAEQAEVLQLVSALSKPAVSQLLPAYFVLDGSAVRPLLRPVLDSLERRPPDGPAGLVRVAYLVATTRRKLSRAQSSVKGYATTFAGQRLAIKPVAVPSNHLTLRFDFAPANQLLDILATPDIEAATIARQLDTPAFDALLLHHSQSFYPVPLTKEQLALCLATAASTQPLARLYRYANPYGLLNYTDVQAHQSQYRQVVDTLRRHEQVIFEQVRVAMLPYLPPGTKLARTVSLFFISGSDGWGANGTAALDINYFKDDYPRLLLGLAHETYHAAQQAVKVPRRPAVAYTPGQQALVEVLNYLFREGTASFATPPEIKPAREYEVAVQRGSVLLADICQASLAQYAPGRLQQLTDEGIAGGGPFYWLGAEMAKTIVQELGASQLAGVIPLGGVAFCRLYEQAAHKAKGKPN